MPSKKFIKLAAAITAASLLTTSLTPAQNLEAQVTEVVAEIADNIAEGDIAAAAAAVDQLQALGIERIVVNGRVVELAQLEAILDDGVTPAELELVLEILGVEAEDDTIFVAAAPFSTTLAEDDEDDFDTGDSFPPGSTG